MRILRYSNYPVRRWRNGGGLLRDVVDGEAWQLRLADIAGSVGFSDYSGYFRHFAIVSGSVRLEFPAGETAACDPTTPAVAFAGSPAPYCELVGEAPARALNLFVEAQRLVATLERIRVEEDHPVSVGQDGETPVAIFVQVGRLMAHGTGDVGGLPAGRFDALVELGAEGVRLSATTAGTVVLVARARARS